MFTAINTMKVRDERGFTLVELLIVIAIIAILAAIAIPQFSQYRKRGYAATVTADARSAYSASAAMIADNPNLAAMTCANLQAAGYNPSPGTTCATAFVNASSYTISISGAAGWGLTGNTTTINQDGQFTAQAAP